LFSGCTKETTKKIRGLAGFEVHIGASSLLKYDLLQVAQGGDQRLEAILSAGKGRMDRMKEVYENSGGVLTESTIVNLLGSGYTRKQVTGFWRKRR